MADKVRFGIFPRLLLRTLFLSLIPLGVVVYVAYISLTEIGDLVLKEGVSAMEELGAGTIENKAKDVAKQLEIFIRAYPQKSVANLQDDSAFQALAVQRVGKTGYTAVQDTRTAVNRFHVNEKTVNMDLHKLEKDFPKFWGIMEDSLGGKDSAGYYDWKDADGVIRKKYMYISTVEGKTADGVQLGLAATTYLDEFSRPMRELDRTLKGTIQERLYLFFGVIAATVILVFLISYFLAKNITKPILYLARVTEQISTGKLGTKIEISRKDEIGVLIQSIRRMQRSLALAIKKIRERSRAG
jgi:methyl-accepting chemotaxis protein